MKCNKTIIFTKDEWLLIDNLIKLGERLSNKRYLNCDEDEAVYRLMEFITDYYFSNKDLNGCELGYCNVRVDTEEQEKGKEYRTRLEALLKFFKYASANKDVKTITVDDTSFLDDAELIIDLIERELERSRYERTMERVEE